MRKDSCSPAEERRSPRLACGFLMVRATTAAAGDAAGLRIGHRIGAAMRELSIPPRGCLRVQISGDDHNCFLMFVYMKNCFQTCV